MSWHRLHSDLRRSEELESAGLDFIVDDEIHYAGPIQQGRQRVLELRALVEVSLESNLVSDALLDACDALMAGVEQVEQELAQEAARHPEQPYQASAQSYGRLAMALGELLEQLEAENFAVFSRYMDNVELVVEEIDALIREADLFTKTPLP